MSYKKIRGHKRRQRSIAKWRERNLQINFNRLNRREYDYAKLMIHPWCGRSVTKSHIPQPSGKTKQLMLAGLLDIYDAWKIQLEQLGQPYYLRIWLFEPRFTQSQVACAIGDKIEYYNGLFFKSGEDRLFKADTYSRLINRLSLLNWEHRLDEDDLESDIVGEPDLYANLTEYIETKQWFEKMLAKPHRTAIYQSGAKFHFFKKGDVWIGSCN